VAGADFDTQRLSGVPLRLQTSTKHQVTPLREPERLKSVVLGHEAPLVQVLDAIRREAPNLDGLPGELREPVAAALHKDPAQRPTAQQIVATLTGGATAGTAGGEATREKISPAGQASASRSQTVNALRELIAGDSRAVSAAASDRLGQLTPRPGAAESQPPVAQPTGATPAQGNPEASMPGIQPSGHVPGDRPGQPSALALRPPGQASRRHGERHFRGILLGAMAAVAVIAMAAVISQMLAKSNPPRPRATTTPRTQAASTSGPQAAVTAIGILQDQAAPGNNGCVVTSIAPNTPVSNAGLRPGDTITRLGGVAVTGCGELPISASFVEILGSPSSITYTDTSSVSHEAELIFNSSSSPPSSSSSANP